jgi:hypothetical protein
VLASSDETIFAPETNVSSSPYPSGRLAVTKCCIGRMLLHQYCTSTANPEPNGFANEREEQDK